MFLVQDPDRLRAGYNAEEEKIKAALKTIMDEDDACQVYNGIDYHGAIRDHGWWYKSFDDESLYLGKSVFHAMETIAVIKARTEKEADLVRQAPHAIALSESARLYMDRLLARLGNAMTPEEVLRVALMKYADQIDYKYEQLAKERRQS